MEYKKETVLLEESGWQCTSYPKAIGTLSLESETFKWSPLPSSSPSTPQFTLPLVDIVGAGVSKEGDLCVYSWPRVSSTSGARTRKVSTFRGCAAKSWSVVLSLWCTGREGACRDSVTSHLASASEEGESPILSSPRPGVRGALGPLLFHPPTFPALPRHLLVYINPVAGSGKGLSVFSELQPMLEDAGCVCDVITLDTRGVPTRELAGMDSSTLYKYEGILAVGGDGSLAEVIEGLMARQDWKRALGSIHLALIPSGSGNGVAVSLAASASLPFSHWTSGHAVAKGGVSSLDLASTFIKWGEGEGKAGGGLSAHNTQWQDSASDSPLRTDGLWGSRRFSFLSLEWALAADIDIESESLRFLGAARFDVYGFIRLLWLRKYRGRFSYLPPPSSLSSEIQGSGAGASPSPHALSGFSREGGKGWGAGEAEIPDSSTSLPTLNHLRPFDHPIPPTWTTVQGTFSLLWAANTSHQSVGVSVSPAAHHSDGTWTVILMKDVSVCTAARALLSLDMVGSTAKVPGVESFKCVAWRLEPEVDGEVGGAGPKSHKGPGNVALDGEAVVYGPVQGEVHPGLLSVYSHAPPGKKGR